ncbi:MAG: penicillin-binding protein 2 [Deltaproteobacteria bacterium]|nr:MAG: penicillin-binding protein 2 [Deltaproteobacteria bacterium]
MVWSSDFDPIETEIYQRRLTRLTFFVLIVFGVLFVRLWSLQIINGPKYRIQSESNRIDLRDILPSRGLIFDRNGQLLVDNRPSFILGVIPEDIRDLDGLREDLRRLVEIDSLAAKEKIKSALRWDPFNPVYIKKGLTRDELARIETNIFSMPGVTIEVKPKRHCIYNTLAAHLIGYLGEIDRAQLNRKGYKENKLGDFVGKFGIEKRWHRHLNGIRGGQQVEVDAYGRILRVVYQKAAEPGLNVSLTMDKDLQMLVERPLHNRVGAIVAMNPGSGEVLAMASSPAFNPNDFARGMDRKGWERLLTDLNFPLQNRVISGQYPPGSLFKIVVALTGLEEGVIDPNERIFCGGSYSFQGRVYRDWKEGGHGYVDLHRALVESCDVYFYKMGQKIGIDTIAKYAKRLGLGRVTGIQLGDEEPGLIPNKAWKLRRWHVPWQEGETLSVAVGQSFTLVTPIQIARFISALFNGGILFRPQVTNWIGRENKKGVFEFKPDVVGRWGLKRENMELVKRALIGVVNEPHGTGRRARLDQIRVAGKTGTAQVIALPEEEESAEERDVPYKFRDHAWFLAVAPAERPVIALAILIEHSGQGGAVAAPIAKDIFKGYLNKVERLGASP